MSARWENFESHITANGLDGASFSAEALAVDMGITVKEATGLIQAYQRRQNHTGDTIYAIGREGRTRGAVWHVGDRTEDARRISQQALDDVEYRWTNSTVPSLRMIADLNPKAEPAVELLVQAFDYNLGQLRHLLSAAPSRRRSAPVANVEDDEGE